MLGKAKPSWFNELLVTEVIDITRVYGGGNAQVYRLRDINNRLWCAKVYAPSETGRQDRMTTEWGALNFLYDNGLNAVPRPVALNPDRRIAVYAWVEGQRFCHYQHSLQDVSDAVTFLVQLNDLRTVPDALRQPFASEACLSLDALVKNLEERTKRLLSVREISAEAADMRRFVSNDLKQFTHNAVQKAELGYDGLNRSKSIDLTTKEWILSPSDFGFHNALKTQTGMIWLDFEYFGWDDPAKTMIDFILHPAMGLDYVNTHQFWRLMLECFDVVGDLARRAQMLYPLYGVKWCLILLNEYLREGAARRYTATDTVIDKTIRYEQLSKARKLLNVLKQHNEIFPYAS